MKGRDFIGYIMGLVMFVILIPALIWWIAGGAHAGVLQVVVCIVLAIAKKLRASYTAWFIAYFVVAIGATWLLSAPRYLMAMPVLPLALALLTDRERGKTVALIALSMLWILYFLPFLLRWQVW